MRVEGCEGDGGVGVGEGEVELEESVVLGVEYGEVEVACVEGVGGGGGVPGDGELVVGVLDVDVEGDGAVGEGDVLEGEVVRGGGVVDDVRVVVF